jgi:hypothetical protein
MPSYRDPETLLIRRQEDEAARQRRPPLQERWPSSPRAPAPGMRRPPPPLARGREQSPPSRPPGTLTAARLRVSTILNATELLAIAAPEGKPRITLRIRLPDRTVTAEIASKSLRKAQTAIREAGADSIALVLQGRLVAGDVIAEAGLSAQPKAAKPPPRSEAPKISHGAEASVWKAPEAPPHASRRPMIPGK